MKKRFPPLVFPEVLTSFVIFIFSTTVLLSFLEDDVYDEMLRQYYLNTTLVEQIVGESHFASAITNCHTRTAFRDDFECLGRHINLDIKAMNRLSADKAEEPNAKQELSRLTEQAEKVEAYGGNRFIIRSLLLVSTLLCFAFFFFGSRIVETKRLAWFGHTLMINVAATGLILALFH